MSLLPGAHADYRKPKNPRHARGERAKTPAKAPAAAAKAKPAAAVPGLGERWSPEIKAALSALIKAHRKGTEGYDESAPPAVVIAWDDVPSQRDAAEIVFHKLVTEADFRFSDDFWLQVPVAYGRQPLRAAHEQFSGLARSIWDAQPAYRDFRKRFLASYLDTCENVGRRECRGYLARLWIGFTEEEALDYATAAINEELALKPSAEVVAAFEGDPQPFLWRRGLSLAPEVRGLVRVLRDNGFDVWAIGSAPQPVLLAEGALAGIDRSRVIGIKQGFERDRFNGQLREPLPLRGGALNAALSALGREPVLTIAARRDFEELLTYGRGLRVVVDRGDAPFVKRMAAGGTLVQPPFETPKK